MKRSTIIMPLLSLLILTGCSHTKPFAVHEENTWFIESGLMSSYPIYCMANKKDNSAEPVCYEPIRVEYKIQSKATNQVTVTLTPATSAPQAPRETPESQAPSNSNVDPRTGPMKAIQKEPTQNILSL